MAIVTGTFTQSIGGLYQLNPVTLNAGSSLIIYSPLTYSGRYFTLDLTPLSGATANAFIAFELQSTIQTDIAASTLTGNYWKAAGANLTAVTAANANAAVSYDTSLVPASAFKINAVGGQVIVRGMI